MEYQKDRGLLGNRGIFSHNLIKDNNTSDFVKFYDWELDGNFWESWEFSGYDELWKSGFMKQQEGTPSGCDSIMTTKYKFFYFKRKLSSKIH